MEGRTEAPTSRLPEQRSADTDLVAALRAGDEACFLELVTAWSPAMLRVASWYVPSHAIAEEVVQDTWLAVLKGLDRFEQRSSLHTWVFRILVNQAKTRGAAERRVVPFSDAFPEESGPTVDPERFRPDDDPEWPHHWASAPAPWVEGPEGHLLSAEVRVRLGTALRALPPRQRAVVSLRDVQGFPAEEVCRMLDLSMVNQRVLLHRGRARLRASLEEYVTGAAG